MANSKFKVDYLRGWRPARRAVLAGSGTTFNLNQSGFTPIALDPSTIKLEEGFTLGPNGIICDFTDWVTWECTVYFSSTDPRVNPGISAAINGTLNDPEGAMGYIRDSNGHNESSIFIRDHFQVTAGQEITWETIQRANGGTISMNGPKSRFSLMRDPRVVTNARTPKRIVWVWAEEAGTLTDNNFQYSFGNGETGTNHGLVLPRSGRITALTANSENGTSQYEIAIGLNGVSQAGGGYSVVVPANTLGNVQTFTTPLEVSAGQRLNFVTIDGNGRSDVIVCAEIEVDL